jgi:glycosyltransferase involved in cell wall biosynthesis
MDRKYNILHYIETSGPGGAETVLVNIAVNIDSERFHSSAILHKSRWLHEQLMNNRIETAIIPSRRSWDMLFLFNLIKYCRSHKIDLIHSHLFGANLYSCLAGAMLRIPVVTTFHNELFFQGRSERFLKLKSFFIRKFASKMIFVAEYMKKDYIIYSRFPTDKLQTIYNGIELNRRIETADISSLSRELGVLEDDLVVGHIANLRAPKGHLYLMEAARQVCERIPHARFFLIGEEGDGSIRKEIENFIAENGLKENVKLLGFRKDVGRLLRLMDIFVLSSTSEGLPLSVIEAMAAARPVVATDVGGLSEIVIPDETGFLVEPRNSRALAYRLITLLENRDLRVKMGEAGEKTVESKFSLKAMIDRYQDLYVRLLK